MTDAVVEYYYDPLCGWCYAAAPLVAALQAAGIAISMHGGGLWAEPQPYPAAMVPQIREMEAGIAATTGQQYGERYKKDILGSPDAILHSLPPIRAILASDAIGNMGLTMLRALQKAHFVEGRRIADARVIAAVAEEAGLARDAFAEAFATADADAHVSATREQMRTLGIHGFPTFILNHGGVRPRIRHEGSYGDPPSFAQHVIDTLSRPPVTA